MSENPIHRLNAALEGRYRIERELGEGGMATVYLAADLKHERKVALKVLRPELAAVVGADRFLAEIKTTANLQHPHILPLFDSGEAGGFLYYVMPHVEGESLRERLNRKKQLPVDEAVGIATKVAAAQQAAHEQGVIHRDIKPANILLSKGEPLISDFGIALAVSAGGGGRLTETGLSLGTPHYMSPEQATGDQTVGPATDIYALGCVLYEMLVGEPPYTGSTPQAILGKIIQAEPVSATKTRRTVPANVDGAIRRALEKVPADRFRTASEFAGALGDAGFRHGAAEAASAAPTSLWNPLSVAATAVAAILGVALVWSTFARQPGTAARVVRYAIDLPEEQEALQTWGSGVALSPDGSRLAYVGRNEARDGLQLWLRNRDQLSADRLAGTEGAWQPFFSPDGQSIGFVTADRDLKVASLRGEPPLTLATGVGRGGGSWGTDGYVYFLPLRRGLARVLATGAGVPEQVSVVDTAGGELGHRWPQALPSSRGVLMTVRYADDPAAIAVLDLAAGDHEVLVQGVYAQYSPTGHLVYVREDGLLLAAPFDEERLTLTGPSVPMLDGVVVDTNPEADLSLSGSGTLVYRTGVELVEPQDLVWVSFDGTIREVDPGWTANFTANFSPIAISPDGTQLAISIDEGGSRQLWVKELDQGPLAKLTFEGSQNIDPTWTPDGQFVVFSSNRMGGLDLYRKRADGSAPAELLFDHEGDIVQSSFSADGEWSVFQLLGTTTDILGFRPSSGEDPVELVAGTSANEVDPALSPDGRWLAYSSDVTSQGEVYVRPFPNVNDARWVVSTDGGGRPQWSVDGRTLFYRGPGPEMIAVEVLDGPTFATGERRVLFPSGDLARWDVAPDGSGFMSVRSRSVDRAVRLIVVENFNEELKRLVPN
jgi:serine/threonine-protein kinase